MIIHPKGITHYIHIKLDIFGPAITAATLALELYKIYLKTGKMYISNIDIYSLEIKRMILKCDTLFNNHMIKEDVVGTATIPLYEISILDITNLMGIKALNDNYTKP